MIIGNQEIAVHLKLVRNLSGVTSGRFMLRVGVQEMIKTGNGTATPFNLLERTTAKTENRSEFDDQHYSSKMFFLKSGVNVSMWSRRSNSTKSASSNSTVPSTTTKRTFATSESSANSSTSIPPKAE